MYPELMVVPMREELTRLGIQELRTAAEVDQRYSQPIRHDDGGGELHLRMRRRAYASRGPGCAAALQPSGKVVHRFCRPG